MVRNHENIQGRMGAASGQYKGGPSVVRRRSRHGSSRADPYAEEPSLLAGESTRFHDMLLDVVRMRERQNDSGKQPSLIGRFYPTQEPIRLAYKALIRCAQRIGDIAPRPES